MTTIPQDWKLLAFAMGKCADAGSPSPYTHTISEVDTDNVDKHTGEILPSFVIEAAKQTWIAGSGTNFVRTMDGCMIDTITISTSEGEPVRIAVAGPGQDITFSSGGASAVTEVTTTPFQWENVSFYLESGTKINKMKNVSISLNNTLLRPNYVDGSRNINTPIPTNRDWEISLTMDTDRSTAQTYYEQYFLGGSVFNCQWAGVVATGSNECWITFSGCELIGMPSPIAAEGISETTLTIRPQTASALVNDTILFYNGGSFA